MVAGPTDLASVEEHPPPPDALECVRDLEVAERAVLGEDVLEERPQLGDIPLAVAQLVDEPALGLLGLDPEVLVERAARRPDAEVGIEDEERVPDGVDDALGVGEGVLDRLLLLSPR